MRNRFPKLYVLVLLYAALMLSPAGAQTVTVAASNIVDSTGTPLASGTISFQPSKCLTSYTTGCATSYHIGGKGQALSSPVTATITNGAFTITLPDTNYTNPQNVGFAVTVTDNTTGDSVLGYGYAFVQPGSQSANSSWCTGSPITCDFDNYIPNIAGLTITTVQGGNNGTTTFNGGTITGATAFQSTVSLSADPTVALQAATKRYVDAHAGAGGFTGGSVANPTAFQSSMTWALALRESGVDLNTLTSCGYFDGSNLADGPSAFGTAYMEIQNVCSADPSHVYLWQFAYDMAGASGTYYARYRDASGWHAWAQQNSGSSTFAGGTVANPITAPSVATNGTGPSGLTVTPNGTDPAPPSNSIVYAAPQSVPNPYDFWAPTNVTAAASAPLPMQCQYFPYSAGPPAVQPHLACSLTAVTGSGGVAAPLMAGQVSGNFYGYSTNNTLTAASMAGIFADSTGTDKHLFLNAPSGGAITQKIANVAAFEVAAGNHTETAGASCTSLAASEFKLYAGDGYTVYCNGSTYTVAAPGASGLPSQITAGQASGNYYALGFSGSLSPASLTGITADHSGTDPNLYLQSASGAVQAKEANVVVASMSANGVQVVSSTSTCSSTAGGTFNYVAGATGVKDTVQVCAKDASNTYAWRTIY